MIVLLAIFVCACTENKPPPPPDDALWVATAEKSYRIRIPQKETDIPIANLTYWDLQFELSDGTPFVPANVSLSADMPGHGHGMNTRPTATESLPSGAVRVDGLQFHMSGHWRVRINLDGPLGADQVEFDLHLRPPETSQAKALKLFTPADLALLESLRIDQLPELQSDPSNRLSGNSDAISLGKELFFEAGLSKNGNVSCATCHQPDLYFADDKAHSIGSAKTKRNAPTLIGVGHASWFYWDGRRDSVWSQALTPLETVGEMDTTRVDVVRFIMTHDNYGPAFIELTNTSTELLSEEIYKPGSGPYADQTGRDHWRELTASQETRVNQAFASAGKIMAAYVEQISPQASRFDRFVNTLMTDGEDEAVHVLDAQEISGLKIFLDASRTQCMRCHNGPLLTNQQFHNIGTSLSPDGSFDFGRSLGLQAALVDEFNCQGDYSDAPRSECKHLRFAAEEHLSQGAFKTPTLRNIGKTAPYMHDGAYPDLWEVMNHYRQPPAQQQMPHELPPLDLSDEETRDLIAFLKTL